MSEGIAYHAECTARSFVLNEEQYNILRRGCWVALINRRSWYPYARRFPRKVLNTPSNVEHGHRLNNQLGYVHPELSGSSYAGKSGRSHTESRPPKLDEDRLVLAAFGTCFPKYPAATPTENKNHASDCVLAIGREKKARPGIGPGTP